MTGLEYVFSLTLFLILTLIILWWTRKEPTVQILVLFTFLLRVVLILLDQQFHLIPYTRDYALFMNTIFKISSGWQSGNFFPISEIGSVQIFSYIMAPLFFIGKSMITLSIFNSFLGALATYNVFRLTATLFQKVRGIKACFVFALYPSFIHYSSIPMRDSLLILLFTEFAYLLVKWVRENRPSKLKISLTFLAIVALRPENFIVVTPPLIVSTWYTFLRGRKKRIISAIIFIPVLLLVFIFGTKLFLKEIPTITPQSLTTRRNWLSRATGEIGGNYLSNVKFHSWSDILAFAPKGAFYFLFVPLPWTINVSNLFMVTGFLQNLFFLYPLTILALRVFMKSFPKISQAEWILAIMLVCGVVGYGLMEGNMGPAMRHRLQFTFIIFTLASPLIPKIKPFPFPEASTTKGAKPI